MGIASHADREFIYQARHEVYARELGQHCANPAGRLRDALDEFNVYLVAKISGEPGGLISITPPGSPQFSVDKYVERRMLPFHFDERLFEIRLLTVLKQRRGRELATLLMYAALRWFEAHGGARIVAIGRREVVEMYLRCGPAPTGASVQSGAVIYDLLHATVAAVRARVDTFGGLLERIGSNTSWQLDFPFRKPAACFHGGACFEAIGPKFGNLERHRAVINADVLDAWFPPAPGVLSALSDHLPWLLRTSPPAACDGLIETIADTRRVAPQNILPGAGTSDLIFRAFRSWLSQNSHALILEPTYGEYPDYHAARYIQTAVLRDDLAGQS